jgi:hypothetical protein
MSADDAEAKRLTAGEAGETRAASLRRPLVISLSVSALLALVAFWPGRKFEPPPRPALRAPIVLDRLVYHPPPPSDAIPGTSPAAE